ncbi:hypothetical protein E2C01_033543 [Portunus trituberculatus]|uniref:Uncharacterized protein n=1 Tax=Portunus trituberculatus TaxID=210409 RepID=A0A5B7F405_PORTR|nr:hypothetical protein [Portunus trituberculatus]
MPLVLLDGEGVSVYETCAAEFGIASVGSLLRVVHHRCRKAHLHNKREQTRLQTWRSPPYRAVVSAVEWCWLRVGCSPRVEVMREGLRGRHRPPGTRIIFAPLQ